MFRMRLGLIAAATVLALAGCTAVASTPIPTTEAPTAAPQPSTTPTPATYHVPAPTPALDVACDDFGTAASMSALLGGTVAVMDPVVTPTDSYRGIPDATAIRELGRLACIWSDGKSSNDTLGYNQRNYSALIEFIPDATARWNYFLTHGYGTSTLSCSASDGVDAECSGEALSGTNWISIQLTGTGLGATKAAAKVAAQRLISTVTGTLSKAKRSASEWKPSTTELPTSCPAYISGAALTKALAAVEPLETEFYVDDPPAGMTVNPGGSTFIRYCDWHPEDGSAFAGTMEALAGGQWAWDAVVAAHPKQRGTSAVNVAGLAEGDEAWIRSSQKTTDLNLIVGGNWIRFEIRDPYPGTITDDPSTALAAIASTVVAHVYGKDAATAAAPPRTFPAPTTTATIDHVTPSADGPAPTLDISCSDLASPAVVSTAMGIPMGVFNGSQSDFQRFSAIPWGVALRERGGLDCLWSDRVPQFDTSKSEVDEHRLEIYVQPDATKQWKQFARNEKLENDMSISCRPWSGACTVDAYRNKAWVHIDLLGAVSSVEFEKRLTPFFDGVLAKVAASHSVAQTWVKPAASSALTPGCTQLVSTAELKAATGIAKSIKTETSFLWSPEMRLETDSLEIPEITTCAYFTHHETLGESRVYPGGAWAWRELAALPTLDGTSKPVAVDGLAPGNQAFLRCTSAAKGEDPTNCDLDLILGESWVQIELYGSALPGAKRPLTSEAPATILTTLAADIVQKVATAP